MYVSSTDCCGVLFGDETTCDGACGPCNDSVSCAGPISLDGFTDKSTPCINWSLGPRVLDVHGPVSVRI